MNSLKINKMLIVIVLKGSLGSYAQLIRYFKGSLQAMHCRCGPVFITFVFQSALYRRRSGKFVQICVTCQIAVLSKR